MFTITMHDGVREHIKECLVEIENHHPDRVGGITTREELERARKNYYEMKASFTDGLIRILLSTDYDGDVSFYKDTLYNPHFTFGFTYPKTGYCGGLNHHTNPPRWSVNT